MDATIPGQGTLIDSELPGRPASTPRRIYRRLGTAILLLLAVFLTVPWDFYSDIQIIDNARLVDGSWQNDIPGQLAHGRLLGRDFIFTYGPLYQWLHAAGLVIPPGNAASVIRWHGVPATAITILLLWLALALTGAGWVWRAVTFLAWVLIVAAPAAFHGAFFKPMGGLALGVIAGYLLAHSAAARPARGVVPATFVLWGLTAPALTSYSFEFGVFALLALVAAAVVLSVSTWGTSSAEAARLRRRAVTAAAVAIAGAALFVGLIELPTAWQGYLRHQLEIARGYSLTMARAATIAQWGSLLALAVLLMVLAAWLARRGRQWLSRTGRIDRPGVALFCGAAFCLVFLRYGLTRSDWLHWWGATAPSIYLLGILLPAYLVAQIQIDTPRAEDELPAWRSVWQGGLPRRAAVVVVIGCLAIFVVSFLPSQTFSECWSRRWNMLCVATFAPARLAVDPRRELIPEGVARAMALPEQTLYVWPYEAIFGHAAGKVNPAYTVQSLVAHTERLEQATIEQLEAFEDAPVLVCRTSRPVDDVSNMTRTPRIFRYLLEQYELAEPPTEHVALLRRAPLERVWSVEPALEVAEPIAFRPGGGRGVKVRLDDVRLSDLLIVRLRVAPTRMWGIGKPGHLLLIFEREGAPPVIRRVLVPPDGQPHDVLASGMDIADPLFMTHFAPDRQWRSTERVGSLAIVWQPIDVLTMRPDEIALEEIFTLRRDDVAVLETSRDLESDTAVWRWCYLGEPLPAVGAPR